MLSFLAYFLVYLCSYNSFSRAVGLRHNWESRLPVSALAKKIYNMQHDCALERRHHNVNSYGMGSGLTSLSRAFCNSLDGNHPLEVGSRSADAYKDWIWNDQSFCKDQPYANSTMGCYFGRTFNICPEGQPPKGVEWVHSACKKYVSHPGNLNATLVFNAAFFEYLFSEVNPEIVRRAEKEAVAVFGPQGSPDDLITIHIRWGDKAHEMGGLVRIEYYISTVVEIVQKQNLQDVNIFLTTEDPKAAVAFKDHPDVAAKNWKVFMYDSAVSPNLHPSDDASKSKGAFGLTSLIVLLLSMEAKYYVITSGSNWSVLIESLRRGVVDPDCGGCTLVKDLRLYPLFVKQIAIYNKIIRRDQIKDIYGELGNAAVSTVQDRKIV